MACTAGHPRSILCFLPAGGLLLVLVALTLVLQTSSADSDKNQEYPKQLLVVPKGGEQAVSRYEAVSQFVNQHMEPRHAVAIVVAGQGSKRHKMLQDLAENDDKLNFFLAMGIQFGKGSSLVMHRFQYPSVTYEGKWTRGAIRAWLQDTAYPLVNTMQQQFSPPKYFTESPYGTVLIVKELTGQTKELVSALEVYAEMHRDRLKFTFFTKSPGTQKLCDMFGVWTNDELLLLEHPPHDVRMRTHTSVPGAAKYRMEGVTPASIERFFHEYAAGHLPRYYKSSFARRLPVVTNGIRDLSGWDFLEVVNDPSRAVLVEFTSKNCASCDEYAPVYQGLAKRILEARNRDSTAYMNLTIARIDQSAHEHPEVIRGTPWVKFWPKGARRHPADVEARSIEGLIEFLDDIMAQHAPELTEVPKDKRKKNSKADQPAVSAYVQKPGGIRLSQPSPEAARSYLRTDEELPETGDDPWAASNAYLTTEPAGNAEL